MTLREYVSHAAEALRAAAVDAHDPIEHARRLAAEVLRLSPTQMVTREFESLSPADVDALGRALARRCTGEPLQYIVGRAAFWTGEFAVGPGVLIPRPETEILVETALRELPRGAIRIAELGAGSGAIGIAALGERPDWEWWAFEVEPAAATYAETNARALLAGSLPRYRVVRGDFFAAARSAVPFDAIVANPPYVATGELAGLSREVRAEPTRALDGGATGLDTIEALIEFARGNVVPGGKLLLEIGDDQGAAVRARFARAGFQDIGLASDLAGRDRIAWGTVPGRQ